MPRPLAWAIYALAAFGGCLAAAWWGASLGWPAWGFAAAAAALACLPLLGRPALPSGVLIAAALAALAAFLGARSSEALSRSAAGTPVPTYDITSDPLPEDASGFVEIRGHLNMDTHLDEYAVAPGDRPDQNAPADFVLRLLLPTSELAIPADTRFIVARMAKAKPPGRDQGVDVVRGELKTLPPELAAPLFGGSQPDVELRGVLLDAAASAEPKSVAFDLGLALLAALMGLFAFRGAWVEAREPEAAD